MSIGRDQYMEQKLFMYTYIIGMVYVHVIAYRRRVSHYIYIYVQGEYRIVYKCVYCTQQQQQQQQSYRQYAPHRVTHVRPTVRHSHSVNMLKFNVLLFSKYTRTHEHARSVYRIHEHLLAHSVVVLLSSRSLSLSPDFNSSFDIGVYEWWYGLLSIFLLNFLRIKM